MRASDGTGDDAKAFNEPIEPKLRSSAAGLVVRTLLWTDVAMMRILRSIGRGIVEGAIAYGLAVHGYPHDFLTAESGPKPEDDDGPDELWLPDLAFMEFDSMHALIEWVHAQGRYDRASARRSARN